MSPARPAHPPVRAAVRAAVHPGAYTRLQKLLHWGVVLLLLAQYLVFDGMGGPFREGLKTGTMPYGLTSVAHIAIGVLVLAMAAWRLVLRAKHGAPAAPAEEPELARKASKWGHWGLYALLFALPITGSASWFLGIHDLGDIHEIGTNVLLALAGLHVAAALIHQFWWNTDLLSRMR